MTEPFRVPKHKIAAEVCLPGESSIQIKLFLSDCAEGHSGIERPSDLMNGPAAFLPAAGADGRMIFFHRDAVLAVSVEAQHEFGGDVLMAVAMSSDQATTEKVEIVLEGGKRFRGTVSYIMPEGSRRLQDFLSAIGTLWHATTASFLGLPIEFAASRRIVQRNDSLR